MDSIRRRTFRRFLFFLIAIVSAYVMFATGTHTALATTQLSPRDGWQWPTGGPAPVSRGFDPPAERWLAGHRGVDLLVEPGTAIVAPRNGTVVYAGVLVDRPVVSIRTASGLRLTFEPVEPYVERGQTVEDGEVIGFLLSGHQRDALHWGAKFSDDHYIDPLSLLLGPVRLKPW